MARWKDSDGWSYWACAHDGCDRHDCFDPDSVKVTTCGNGHVNYLEPADGTQHRRAFRTAQERAKTLRSEKLMRDMMRDAFAAAQRRKP